MSDHTLAVFVRAPVAGRVKTRLATALGSVAAAAIYRRMGRRVVAGCVYRDRYRTVVWFSPSRAGSQVRSWLGGLGVDQFLAQRSGGLGIRLAAVFERHFRKGADRVVVIGSDCPAVGYPIIARALLALDKGDVVLGPALDGGFYLLGLKAPCPALLSDIAWSTPAVFNQTLANAAALGLDVALLPVLRDVDTIVDARALNLVSG